MDELYNLIVDRDELAKQIGINLEKLRIAMDWTQKKMATVTGVADATMNNYLNGKRLPGIDYLVNLCAIPSIKKKSISLNVNDFLSNTFHPERAQKIKNTVNTLEESVGSADHLDFLGAYICYFYDQSKTVHDQDSKIGRELRFGVLSVFDDYNSVTAEKKIKAFASFYKESELEKVVELKNELTAIFKQNKSAAARNEALNVFYANLDEGTYSGEVTFSAQHAFVNIQSAVYSDNALMILYSPQKRTDNEYVGGIGSIASVAHGRKHMPTAQKIIASKYELGCSFEEISDHLSLSSAPVSQTEEAMALAEICKKLYSDETPMSALLDENDKTAIIETRLNQLVRNYIEKNVCCVGSVSEEEDKKVYALIKKYAD